MSDCKCKSPCNPCNKNCPDDKITVIRDTIDASEPLEVELLDADECSGPCWGCCSSKCNDNCGINIQSTNECLTVDTSECGVVKLTSHCPPIVTAWENVTVDVEDCNQEWCSLNYIVSAQCKDEKVKACPWDSTPWTLIDKIKWEWAIEIDTENCDWWDASLVISIDEDKLPKCPDFPEIEIDNKSQLINATVWGADRHKIYITDKDNKVYYIKLVLSEWHDWIENTMARDTTKSIALINNVATWDTVYNRNLSVVNWRIKITKDWLYQVGFSWSAECWSWVHAFRVQLCSTAQESSDNHTIIESRYSAPIWDQPFEVPNFPWAKIHYVSWVSGGWESGSATASYSDFNFKIDTPLWGPATDIEWTQREANWKSASLWSYVSRMPVWWSTIVELKKNDWLFINVKISSEVRYTWDLLWKMDDYAPHFALLCKNSVRSWWVNTWPECGLSFYANLIHPLNLS